MGHGHFTVEDAIRTVLQERRLRFAPGSQWSYSNINYVLLAEIVRQVSGLTLAEFEGGLPSLLTLGVGDFPVVV